MYNKMKGDRIESECISVGILVLIYVMTVEVCMCFMFSLLRGNAWCVWRNVFKYVVLDFLAVKFDISF